MKLTQHPIRSVQKDLPSPGHAIIKLSSMIKTFKVIKTANKRLSRFLGRNAVGEDRRMTKKYMIKTANQDTISGKVFLQI